MIPELIPAEEVTNCFGFLAIASDNWHKRRLPKTALNKLKLKEDIYVQSDGRTK